MKILHLHQSVGGNSFGLSRGERAHGHDSDCLVLVDNKFSFPADRILFKTPGKSIWGRAARRLAMVREFWRVRSGLDVLHFNMGSSLIHFPYFGFPHLDLPFYSDKTKLVFTYNGCDSRQKQTMLKVSKESPCRFAECYNGICNNSKIDEDKRNAISKMAKYAHAVFAISPDLFRFLPTGTKLLPCMMANWNDVSELPMRKIDGTIKIVHAPTNRIVKGTADIIETIKKLNKKYHNRFELRLIENLTNREVLNTYAQADLIIDQIRLGWYGTAAVEGMKLGRPVIAYINPDDLHNIDQKMARDAQESFLCATGGTLEEKLTCIMENPKILHIHQQAGLEYVHKWHDPVKIAKMVLSTYQEPRCIVSEA